MNEFKYKMENFQKVKDKENNFKLFIKKKKKKQEWELDLYQI